MGCKCEVKKERRCSGSDVLETSYLECELARQNEELHRERCWKRRSLLLSANQGVLKGFGHVKRMGGRMIEKVYEFETESERLWGKPGLERSRGSTGSQQLKHEGG